MKRGRKTAADRLPTMPDLRAPWQIENAARCGCGGADDMCPCQNDPVCFRHRPSIEDMRALLADALAFIDEEADNRAAAGSSMSDYERGPLLHVMIDRGDWLRFRCQVCDRDKMITGYEACYTYGHGVTFDELRVLVKARCGKGHCGVQIGVALKEERPVIADGRQKLAGQV